MPKSIKIGAGWKKDGYISVTLNNKATLAVFPNDKKTKDNQPDFNLVMSTEQATQMDLLSDYDKERISKEPI